MGDFNPALVIGIIIAIALITAFVPVITGNIANAREQYKCLNDAQPIQSTDMKLCTNTTLTCVAPTPIYNVTTSLCTNSSGVAVINASRVSGFLAYNESASNVGISTTESALMSLIVLFLVIATVFGFIKASGFGK